jgi:hypothetical protein
MTREEEIQELAGGNAKAAALLRSAASYWRSGVSAKRCVGSELAKLVEEAKKNG